MRHRRSDGGAGLERRDRRRRATPDRAVPGPVLLGRDATDIPGALQAMDRAAFGNPFTKAAVEMALFDLWGLAEQRPVVRPAGWGLPAARAADPVLAGRQSAGGNSGAGGAARAPRVPDDQGESGNRPRGGRGPRPRRPRGDWARGRPHGGRERRLVSGRRDPGGARDGRPSICGWWSSPRRATTWTRWRECDARLTSR